MIELKVFKYNVQVEIARSKETITDDELVCHFMEIHKAWLKYKKHSEKDIKRNSLDLCSSCVFEERKPNPELEKEGPAIIAATEKLLETLQGCYDQLGDVELTDQGARIVPCSSASAPENPSESQPSLIQRLFGQPLDLGVD